VTRATPTTVRLCRAPRGPGPRADGVGRPHGSGEIFLAFSTARGADALADAELDALFSATVDATEEAVLNALWSAERAVGREGRVAEALPPDGVLAPLEDPSAPLRPQGRIGAPSESRRENPRAAARGRVQSEATKRSLDRWVGHGGRPDQEVGALPVGWTLARRLG
jgi:hypothetical protein